MNRVVLLVVSSFVVVQCHKVVVRDAQVINEVIDEFLLLLKNTIQNGGLDQIPIPDLSKTFEKKWHSFHFSGSFAATDGWFKNLSSLQRTGDAVLNTTADAAQLELFLGLGHMEVGYSQYNAKFMHIIRSGSLTATLNHNSIGCQISLTMGKTCEARVDRAEINEFSGLDLQVTGLGNLDFILHTISSWVVDHLQDKIKDKISRNLKTALGKAINKFDICKKFGY